MLEQLLEAYPNDIRVVFRHFPLPNHPLSMLGTQAAEAAHLQGKFWEMTEHLLARQSEWSSMDLASFETYLNDKASELGLDAVKFKADLKSDVVVSLSQGFLNSANTTGVSYTPFITINGNIPEDPTNPQYLGLLIQLLKLEDIQYKSCPPQSVEAGKTYQATIDTEKGKIVIDLFGDAAPLTVNSFVFLANEGWYGKTNFFEVVRDTTSATSLQVAVAGDPSGTGYGSAGYRIDFENPTAKFDKKGLLGMVNGSQFFITYAPQSSLDGKFTVFGEVVEGMDIVEGFPLTVDPSGNVVPGIKINSITINER